MKIPKTIDIYGKPFKIKFQEDLTDEFGTPCDGIIDKETIYINTYLKEKDKKEVLIQSILHELFHGVIRRLGLKQANFSDDLEEIICDSFATYVAENFIVEFKNEDERTKPKFKKS